MKTSYQRLKIRHDYEELRGKQLEDIIHGLCEQMKMNGIKPLFPLGNGLSGDELITDISSGEFTFNLLMKYGDD